MSYYIDNNAQLTFFPFCRNVTIQYYEKHVGLFLYFFR